VVADDDEVHQVEQRRELDEQLFRRRHPQPAHGVDVGGAGDMTLDALALPAVMGVEHAHVFGRQRRHRDPAQPGGGGVADEGGAIEEGEYGGRPDVGEDRHARLDVHAAEDLGEPGLPDQATIEPRGHQVTRGERPARIELLRWRLLAARI